MSTRADGGQAFPVPKLILAMPPADRKGLETMRLVSSGGMTMLDWFAGQIASGMVADWDDAQHHHETMAAIAYSLAYALVVRKAEIEDAAAAAADDAEE